MPRSISCGHFDDDAATRPNISCAAVAFGHVLGEHFRSHVGLKGKKEAEIRRKLNITRGVLIRVLKM